MRFVTECPECGELKVVKSQRTVICDSCDEPFRPYENAEGGVRG